MFFGYIDPGSGFTIFSLSGWLIAFLLSFLGAFLFFFKKIFKSLKKHKWAVFIIFLIVVVLVLVRGVIIDKKESKFNKKVVILGFDGLSPEIIEPMMEEGELPNFTRLKQQGSYRHLSTTNPSQSPVAWAGFATGQNPGKNGIFDFIVREPETYRLKLSLSNVEKGKAKRVIKARCFWQYTSEAKVPTVIISCPVTFPPDRVYGRMLSGMGVPDILGTEGTFSFYTSEPIDKKKDIGGKVFEVRKGNFMKLDLVGPRIKGISGKGENAKVPFAVTLEKDNISIDTQKRHFELKTGEWSDWQSVVFNLGFLKKMHGILKFYLVETQPHFKLYASPINFDPRKSYFPISYPRNYSKELVRHLGLYYTQGMPFHTWAVNEKRLTEQPFLQQANEVIREKKAMLDFELGRFKKGILFCYFESPDIIQHMFWRYTDTKHPVYEEAAPQEYKKMIESWYKKMDSILGNTMEKMNEEDILIVLSDHGFDTFRRAVHINSWLRTNGYLELENPHAESGGPLLGDIDWSGTKAYAIGFGAVYINQKGRERDGIVEPGRETELLKEEISRKLKQWRDKKYQEQIVSRVYTREDIFWGDCAAETPDLYVGFNIGYRASWQTALGEVPETLIEDNLKKWSGSHLFDPQLIPGILFSNKSIIKENTSIYDITPTVLKICGFNQERLKKLNLDGEPLF